jgi:hypothetical protein
MIKRTKRPPKTSNTDTTQKIERAPKERRRNYEQENGEERGRKGKAGGRG